jgi:hypothetical protein
MATATRAQTSTSLVLRRRQLGELDDRLQTPGDIWEAPAAQGRPTTDDVRRRRAATVSVPEDVEAQIAATLARPIAPGESHRCGYDRRERELRELFARLPAAQRHALRRRLAQDGETDALAVAFRRFVRDRRLRLLAVLASR